MKNIPRFQYRNGKYLPEELQFNNHCKKYTLHQSTRYINVLEGKALPELYDHKNKCCGCSMCVQICPVGKKKGQSAIIMMPDEEGFLYPVVDGSLCIRCYKCVNICVFKKYI